MPKKSPFRYSPGGFGTEPNQAVTPENLHHLPPGSVVRNGDGSRIIHLHGSLWLWLKTGTWLYDDAKSMARRLDPQSVVCHLAP